MTSKVETFDTHLGSIDVETAECSNCGLEVLAEESISVVLDPYETTCSGALICDAKTMQASESASLCDYCAESIFGYQQATRFGSQEYLKAAEIPVIWANVLTVAGGIILAAALILATVEVLSVVL